MAVFLVESWDPIADARLAALKARVLRRLEASFAPPDVAPAPITSVDLVDEEDRSGCPSSSLTTAFSRSLEIAAVSGFRQAGGAHVEASRSWNGHATRGVPPRRSSWPGYSAMAVFADARITHQKRVVLAAAAEHLDAALDLVGATDQGIGHLPWWPWC